jgi:hypothetical protein
MVHLGACLASMASNAEQREWETGQGRLGAVLLAAWHRRATKLLCQLEYNLCNIPCTRACPPA